MKNRKLSLFFCRKVAIKVAFISLMKSKNGKKLQSTIHSSNFCQVISVQNVRNFDPVNDSDDSCAHFGRTGQKFWSSCEKMLKVAVESRSSTMGQMLRKIGLT